MPAPALSVRGLRVRLGAQVLAGPVDLEVAPRERVALVGGSGVGKSLTLRAVAGSLPPALSHDGEIAVDGRVAWLAQDSAVALHPLVPLARQLALPLRRRGVRRDVAGVRVADALARVGLDARHGGSRPGELSGGERQRGCLALALLTEPTLLLADEPTTALDTVAQRQVLDALGALDAAVLLVTHDPAVAHHVCDRVVAA
ncbi:ATP-binding cassette domain-containing protein [Nocardioides sp. CFH 31398]|uniref:ATP-binding cassette domain-containing protein n=1 Tax=Nocardioides sp. CFH 31398 TaxID=2919579 RepID=UPI001F05AF33|nr:ATP-binding cassette domain-containing protein [Nocardioides sp. CFH 31398]MCH1866245.1 ATP-binding cassette domain-containing protein [Nocardioides sp. CFH 31398]